MHRVLTALLTILVACGINAASVSAQPVSVLIGKWKWYDTTPVITATKFAFNSASVYPYHLAAPDIIVIDHNPGDVLSDYRKYHVNGRTLTLTTCAGNQTLLGTSAYVSSLRCTGATITFTRIGK